MIEKKRKVSNPNEVACIDAIITLFKKIEDLTKITNSKTVNEGYREILDAFKAKILTKKDYDSNKWTGADFSYKLNTETQISLFYGSQKGGLVCANGICTEQPGFENGYKITFRSLF